MPLKLEIAHIKDFRLAQDIKSRAGLLPCVLRLQMGRWTVD